MAHLYSHLEYDLNKHERAEEKTERLQAMIEAAAEPAAREAMKYLDSDVLEAAFSQATLDDFRHLEEDLHPDTKDLAHAGLILHDIVYRYVFQEAVKDQA